jgi:photosystem II stability/assembly factor-like uncharacterized protein
MKQIVTLLLICFVIPVFAQKKKIRLPPSSHPPILPSSNSPILPSLKNFDALKFRNIGPFRGGRSVAAVGVPGDPMTYYFGSTGGGVWKTEDAGYTWRNISDGFFKSGSVGAIAIAPSDKNVLYVGMGEHPVRGVMTSHGDGIYKSTDGGQTWKHTGLPDSRHIAAIRIHPQNPDLVYVTVQGALWGPSEHRGIYRSKDGGQKWEKVHYINENTGAADLSMDVSNPRILYAGMWDHQRYPWKVRSGGDGSGIWKSVDGGDTWQKLKTGLPEKMGKVAVAVSPANPQRVYANIEAEKGGVFRSDDAGKTWQQVNSQRVTVARAWYYIEIFPDPVNPDGLYVLNAPMLKSTDGGRSFQPVPNPHSDQHDLWINPANPQNMILANDGGACVTFNGGQTWSSQSNQPTAQFYRVIADRRFPYHLYAGQQDNSTVCIASHTMGDYIGEMDWYPVSGGESAFLAFDPDKPQLIYGTSIQGAADVYDHETEMVKDIMAYPQLNLGTLPKDMRYRFNWNNPVVAQPQDPKILYHGAQKLLRSADGGYTWSEISPDLTRNDTTKHGAGGEPFTNEAAGGEVYNTISYIACSPHKAGVIWAGTDDGLVHWTGNEGKNWQNVTPPGLAESLINAIEVSPHDPATAYVAVTRYKFNDLTPLLFITYDFGKTWNKAVNGLPSDNFVRVVREDPKQRGLLYAGTENGLYLSFDGGKNWQHFQSNLPVCPITDITISDNDLVVATSGRAFWILDDLGALQQSLGKPDTMQLAVFQPKPTYKYTTFAATEPSPYYGQNPPSGVIFDYYLPHNWKDSLVINLDVLDKNGRIIRTLSSKKSENFKGWPGGPPPPQVLPAKPGLNRFNWDLRREMMPGIEGVFLMGDYRGHLVAPGDYTIRLFSKQDTVETIVKILPDPRLNASHADFEEQQSVLSHIEKTVLDIHESVNRLRSVKKQLNDRLGLIRNMEGQDALVKQGETVAKSITGWEEKLIQPRQETFQDVINFRNMLSSELLNLRSAIDTHDPRPTNGAKQRLNDLLAEWETWKMEMERIIGDEVMSFNTAYQAAGLPVLILQR